MTDNQWFALRDELGTDGSEITSPDVILGKAKPDPAYAKQYDVAFNRVGNFTGHNYVYVRGKNAGTAQAIGTVMAYAARLADIASPSKWIALHTSDARQGTNISASAGGVGVNGVPLIWDPPATLPPPDAPWCLIAEIVGDGHPAITVPATIADKAGFDAWLADQPRMAYTIVQLPKVMPVVAPTFSWARIVELDNATPITLTASVSAVQGPAGGSLAYSFDAPDSSGQPIGVGKTVYQSGSNYSQSRTVPASFNSTLTLSYTPPNDEDSDAQFSIQVATESGDGDDGDLGDTTVTTIANYVVRFGETPGGGSS